MPRLVLLILLLICFALGGTLGYYNAQPVRFSYIVGAIEVPLIALIVGEFLVAVLLTLLVVQGRMFTLNAELRRLRRQLQNSEAELTNLRGVSADTTAAQQVAAIAPPAQNV